MLKVPWPFTIYLSTTPLICWICKLHWFASLGVPKHIKYWGHTCAHLFFLFFWKLQILHSRKLILFYSIIIHVSYEIPLPIIHPMACHSTHATTRSCCSWFSTFDTHTEATVAAASNKAIGSAALSSPAPGVASEKAAAPTIRVPRYATTNSSAESARPATVMPATKAHAFSPPSGLGSSLSSMWGPQDD